MIHAKDPSRPVAGGHVEREVIQRYAAGAREAEAALCCPTTGYDTRLLEKLPREIIEKDYGCGDPSRHVQEGETVVDLGSGAGKICYMLAQTVGTHGRVIGLDFNDAMLALARKYQDEMARKLGCRNVAFHKARIQDMALDLERAQAWLKRQPVASIEALSDFEAECERLRREEPLVESQSVDVVVSNCVLNLVRPQDKQRLFAEIHRVLRNGGRAVISDIVCDEEPTPQILADPKLWSGCISGAFREDRFLQMFEEAGFHGVEILSRAEEPWQVIDGVEFRSMTVRAYKGKEGPCMERNQAVVYKGPWKEVRDDDGHILRRGQRMAACDKTFRILTNPAGPYAGQIIGVQPLVEVPPDAATPFDCHRSALRHPRQTKGLDYHDTRISDGNPVCAPGRGCC
jgi:SAM-dependent methyltransferase